MHIQVWVNPKSPEGGERINLVTAGGSDEE